MFWRARLPGISPPESKRFNGVESEDSLDEAVDAGSDFLLSKGISSTREVTVGLLDDLKVATHNLRTSSERTMWKQKMKNPCRVFKMAKRYWKARCSKSMTRMLNDHVKPSKKVRNSTIRTICMLVDLVADSIFFPRERMELMIAPRTVKL